MQPVKFFPKFVAHAYAGPEITSVLIEACSIGMTSAQRSGCPAIRQRTQPSVGSWPSGQFLPGQEIIIIYPVHFPQIVPMVDGALGL